MVKLRLYKTIALNLDLSKILKPLIFCLISINVNAQLKTFDQYSDVSKYYKGDTIAIKTDSVFILSGGRAEYLNQRLNELDTIRRMYSDLSIQREEFHLKIDELDSLLKKLQIQMKNDSLQLRNNLQIVIDELAVLSQDLKENNQSLKNTNRELENRIESLNAVIKDLKREMRWIWWNGLNDKIVAFSAGILIGALVIFLI